MMIPKIDPDVKYIGSSKLRDLTAIELRALTGAIVVTGAQNTPLVVILPYETYLKMQEIVQGRPLRGEYDKTQDNLQRLASYSGNRAVDARISDPTTLDAVGPELSSGRGKATTETRTMRQKGDTKR